MMNNLHASQLIYHYTPSAILTDFNYLITLEYEEVVLLLSL